MENDGKKKEEEMPFSVRPEGELPMDLTVSSVWKQLDKARRPKTSFWVRVKGFISRFFKRT